VNHNLNSEKKLQKNLLIFYKSKNAIKNLKTPILENELKKILVQNYNLNCQN